MANPHMEAEVERSVHDTMRTVAEQTGHAGRLIADVGERTFHAQTEMLQRNAEAFQHAVQTGSELASRLTNRSAERFAEAFSSGGQGAERVMSDSGRTLNAVVGSSATLSRNAQDVSRQWFDLMHQQLEKYMEHIDALARCRTPQEFVAAQSNALRDHLTSVIETTRRTADLSVQAAQEASRVISEAAEQGRRAA